MTILFVASTESVKVSFFVLVGSVLSFTNVVSYSNAISDPVIDFTV